MKHMLRKVINFPQYLIRLVRPASRVRSDSGIVTLRQYQDYNDYVNHQIEKTTDPSRIEKWLHQEWESKVAGFKEIFIRDQKYVQGKQRALCLGSRTGQEVRALLDMEIAAIGIDLVPFPPYTIEGDIHYLVFNNEEFDLIFTNIFDHSLHPEKFCSEMERVCSPGGIIIVHLLLGPNVDKYTETVVFHPEKVIAMFKTVEVKESRRIKNTIDMLNWELILEKKQLAVSPQTDVTTSSQQ